MHENGLPPPDIVYNLRHALLFSAAELPHQSQHFLLTQSHKKPQTIHGITKRIVTLERVTAVAVCTAPHSSHVCTRKTSRQLLLQLENVHMPHIA